MCNLEPQIFRIFLLNFIAIYNKILNWKSNMNGQFNDNELPILPAMPILTNYSTGEVDIDL